MTPSCDIDGLGISLSGGGIRSAIFNLGVLQVLQEHRVLGRAKYLSAVSGGSYIAGALYITAAESQPGEFREQGPWAANSPEELHLRQNMHYLAPGLIGRVWLLLNFTYGAILNYLPFLMTCGLAGRVSGWILRWIYIDIAPNPKSPFGVAHPNVPFARHVIEAGILVGLFLVGYRRFTDREGALGKSRSAKVSSLAASITIFVTAGLAISATAFPLAIVYYRRTVGQIFGWFKLGSPPPQIDRFLVANLAVATFVLFSALLILLTRNGRLSPVASAASLLGSAGLIGLPFVAAAESASEKGLNEVRDLVETILIFAALLFFAVYVHSARYSMHLYYRERLSTVFAVRRLNGRAAEISYSTPLFLTKLLTKVRAREDLDLPEPIFCASVGLAKRLAPQGRFSAPFSFDADEAGGKAVGFTKTEKLESFQGKVQLTLPAMLAISGAAVSPMMGRFTDRRLQFLMALCNFRLGVWLPSTGEAQKSSISDPSDTGEQTHLSWFQKRWANAVRGWYEPGALYVLREGLGAAKPSNRFLHVSDGGHIENLGILELFSRRCRRVICFDASSSPESLFADLGRAIALARSELGIDIVFPPGALEQLATTPLASACVAKADVLYPDGQIGEFFYAKCVVDKSAPVDVTEYRVRNTKFPRISTADQFYDDERFEAYRGLGRHVAQAALSAVDLPRSNSSESPRKGRAGATG